MPRRKQNRTIVEAVTCCELLCPADEEHHRPAPRHEHRREMVAPRQQQYVYQQPSQSNNLSTSPPQGPTNNGTNNPANSFEMAPLPINSFSNNTQGETMHEKREAPRDIEAVSAKPRALLAQDSSFSPDQRHAAMQSINGATEGAVLALTNTSPAATIALRIAQVVSNVTATVAPNVTLSTRIMNGTQGALALALMGFTIALYAQDISCDTDERAECKAFNVVSWVHTGLAFFTGIGVPLAYHAANPQQNQAQTTSTL